MILRFDEAGSQVSEEMMACSIKQMGSHLGKNQVISIPHIIQPAKFQMGLIFNWKKLNRKNARWKKKKTRKFSYNLKMVHSPKSIKDWEIWLHKYQKLLQRKSLRKSKYKEQSRKILLIHIIDGTLISPIYKELLEIKTKKSQYKNTQRRGIDNSQTS